MAKKTSTKAVKEVATKANVEALMLEYDSLRSQEKAIKARKDAISTMLKDFAESNGVRDTKGSFYYSGEKFHLGKVAKKSISFDTNSAVLFFQSKGLTDCVKFEPTVVEEKVEEHIAKGEITLEDMDKITKEKVTYSVSLVEKEAMPEVQQTTVVAASKKPKLSIKRS